MATQEQLEASRARTNIVIVSGTATEYDQYRAYLDNLRGYPTPAGDTLRALPVEEPVHSDGKVYRPVPRWWVRQNELPEEATAPVVEVDDLTYLLLDDLSPEERARLVGKYRKWDIGIDVEAGEVLQFHGEAYEVIQAHTTQADWPPDTTASLFTRHTPEGTIADWVQPLGGHDAYALDAIVRHNGEIWISTLADNVWEPGVTGWELYEEDSGGGDGGVTEWAPGQTVAVGDQRTYNGNLYECLQGHTTQTGWEPPNTPALWTDLGAA